jgi:hypothetical protein
VDDETKRRLADVALAVWEIARKLDHMTAEPETTAAAVEAQADELEALAVVLRAPARAMPPGPCADVPRGAR